MRYLSILLVALFFLQSCDTTEPGNNNSNQNGTLAAPVLVSPTNGQADISSAPVLTWNAVSGATHYLVQISTRADFTTIEDSATVDVMAYQMKKVTKNTQYYWHVRAVKGSDASAWSETRSFTIAGQVAHIGEETKLTFESVNMATMDRDTMVWEIVEQDITYNGKSNVTRVFLLQNGDVDEIFFNFESNGNFSIWGEFDDEEEKWLELPYATKQGYSLKSDTSMYNDLRTISQRSVSYDGPSTITIEDEEYAIETVALSSVDSTYDLQGELVEAGTSKNIFGFSSELNFLVSFDYIGGGSDPVLVRQRLIKIEN